LYIDLFVIIPVAVSSEFDGFFYDSAMMMDIYEVGRTLPYPMIHPKRPTASLVSRNVLVSIIGQIIITSAVQFWAFFWVRNQPWYV